MHVENAMRGSDAKARDRQYGVEEKSSPLSGRGCRMASVSAVICIQISGLDGAGHARHSWKLSISVST